MNFEILQLTYNKIQQIENEYGNIEGQYGQGGKEYVKWAADMALTLDAGVPWVMCRQSDAPETIVRIFTKTINFYPFCYFVI